MIVHAESAIRFTLITTVLLGRDYPLVMTGIAHLFLRNKADGQLISASGTWSARRSSGRASPANVFPRPSFRGRQRIRRSNSSGSNFAQSNKKLIDRIQGDVAAYQKQLPGRLVPIDLVTASGSGLDPDITPAAALYQVHRVAEARHMTDDAVQRLVMAHVQGRQFGILGEPRVNVLELNLALDDAAGK